MTLCPLPTTVPTSTSTTESAADFVMKLQWLFDEVAMAISPDLSDSVHYRPPAIVVTSSVGTQCTAIDDREQSAAAAAAAMTSLANWLERLPAESDGRHDDHMTSPPNAEMIDFLSHTEMTSFLDIVAEADRLVNEFTR